MTNNRRHNIFIKENSSRRFVRYIGRTSSGKSKTQCTTYLKTKKLKKEANIHNNLITTLCNRNKFNCTVIIDKDKYEEKIFKLLNDKDTYVILKNDLTKNIKRKLNKFTFELCKIDRLYQKEYFYLRSTDAIAPRIYGLTKIHKPDWRLRPIVSFINSPLYSYNLSKFVAKILTPLINSNNLSTKKFIRIGG